MPQTVYNYEWLLAKLKWLVYFNDGQANQAFAGPSTDADKHFRDAINEAYREEIEEAQLNTMRAAWHRTHDLIWPNAQVTLELPDILVDKGVVEVRDITEGVDGPLLDIGDHMERHEIWRKDSNILQWGTEGPGQETTMRFTYLAEAEELNQKPQRPKLVPARFIWLIVFSAGILMREVGEDKAPTAWYNKREALRENFHKSISRGWPMKTNGPRIRNVDDSM